MRKWIDLIEGKLDEKIVHIGNGIDERDWLKTVVSVNPTASEFNSRHYKQPNTSGGPATVDPRAAGVIMRDGTVCIGLGNGLSHEDIADYAGLNIENEQYRLQIHDGKVVVEIWIDDDVVDDLPDRASKVEIDQVVENQCGKNSEQIISDVEKAVRRFTQWKVVVKPMSYTNHRNLFELD